MQNVFHNMTSFVSSWVIQTKSSTVCSDWIDGILCGLLYIPTRRVLSVHTNPALSSVAARDHIGCDRL